MKVSELERLCEVGNDLFARGDAFGATGNLSVRLENEIWITPTGQPLKGLDPDRLARIDLQGEVIGTNRPSKEYPFHLAIYRARSDLRAIVHMHAPHSVAVSCLAALDPIEPIPAITPYYIMRVSPLTVVPYFRPGSNELAAAVRDAVADHDCMLLRNHGSICAGGSIAEAMDRALELEETARLFLLLRHHDVRHLTSAEVDELRKSFPR